MATFKDLMDAAVRADKAGDADAARMLVQMAKQAHAGTQADQKPVGGSGALTPKAWGDNPRDIRPTPKVDRFGDTIAAATKGPRQAFGAYAGGLADQSQSPTMQHIPEGVPAPLRSAGAAAGDLAMTGLAGLGVAYAGAAGLAGEMFGGSPTNERKLAADLMMAGEVAVPELAGVSGTVLAGGKAASAAKSLDAPMDDVQRMARAADRIGVTPSLGAGGKVRGMTAGTLEKVPGTGPLIEADAVRFVAETERAFNAAKTSLGTAGTANETGARLQGGLRAFVDRFQVQAEKLFSDVGAQIPAGTTIKADETVAYLKGELAP